MGVDLRKKRKDLSTSEREERGYGEGVSTEDVCESESPTMSYYNGKTVFVFLGGSNNGWSGVHYCLCCLL